MNDIDNAISQLNVAMPKNLKIRSMTEQERAQLAVLDSKKYFRKKYRLALQFGAKMQLHEFYRIQPEWGSKDVLVEIMKNYKSDFPSEIVLEMAQYIVTEWEKIRASKDYTPEQKAEIETAIEESYNPKNWIAHEEVMKKYEWLKNNLE